MQGNEFFRRNLRPAFRLGKFVSPPPGTPPPAPGNELAAQRWAHGDRTLDLRGPTPFGKPLRTASAGNQGVWTGRGTPPRSGPIRLGPMLTGRIIFPCQPYLAILDEGQEKYAKKAVLLIGEDRIGPPDESIKARLVLGQASYFRLSRVRRRKSCGFARGRKATSPAQQGGAGRGPALGGSPFGIWQCD
jgi:hypothetical protein